MGPAGAGFCVWGAHQRPREIVHGEQFHEKSNLGAEFGSGPGLGAQTRDPTLGPGPWGPDQEPDLGPETNVNCASRIPAAQRGPIGPRAQAQVPEIFPDFWARGPRDLFKWVRGGIPRPGS